MNIAYEFASIAQEIGQLTGEDPWRFIRGDDPKQEIIDLKENK
jgi:hypothetical protein